MKGLATWGLIGILGLIIIVQAWGVGASTSSVPLKDPWGTDRPLVSKGTQLIVVCGKGAKNAFFSPKTYQEGERLCGLLSG